MHSCNHEVFILGCFLLLQFLGSLLPAPVSRFCCYGFRTIQDAVCCLGCKILHPGWHFIKRRRRKDKRKYWRFGIYLQQVHVYRYIFPFCFYLAGNDIVHPELAGNVSCIQGRNKSLSFVSHTLYLKGVHNEDSFRGQPADQNLLCGRANIGKRTCRTDIKRKHRYLDLIKSSFGIYRAKGTEKKQAQAEHKYVRNTIFHHIQSLPELSY